MQHAQRDAQRVQHAQHGREAVVFEISETLIEISGARASCNHKTP